MVSCGHKVFGEVTDASRRNAFDEKELAMSHPVIEADECIG